MTKKEILKKARRVKAIVTDVDGVLTDGGIIYGPGGMELKKFHIQDGMGVKLARKAGLLVFIVSGRSSAALVKRARELGVDRLWQGATDKNRVFDIIIGKYGLSPSDICCIGDDFLDLPILARAGLGVAVPNAAPDVKRSVSLVTKKRGGEGALRELVELVLKAKGVWDKVIDEYRF